ncbi:MAG: hypothetical protein J5685_00830 [Clostridiales bacterium]|nr:hypothetical protein [Clostridiales bacterium]
MLFRKIKNSFSLKVFLITFSFQLLLCTLICALLFFAAPKVASIEQEARMEQRVGQLVFDLSSVELGKSGDILDEFIRETDCCLYALEPDSDLDSIIPLPGMLACNSKWELSEYNYRVPEDSYTHTSAVDVRFKDGQLVTLVYTYVVNNVNALIIPLTRTLPLIILTAVILSAVFSYLYYRLFGRPVKDMSDIALKMSGADPDGSRGRTDELGKIASGLTRMNEELQIKNDELAAELKRVNELEEEKTVFFMAASHELKTPVTIMEGQLTGMIEGVAPYDNTEEYLPKLLRNVKRMRSLIEEIFMVSKIKSDTALESEEIDISKLLENVFENDRDLLDIRNISVDAAITPGIRINGNRDFLGIAMEAFLSNAVFYSEEGSAVSVVCTREDGGAKIKITNEGYISDDDLEHLFDAFYRSDKSRSRKTGGSGLGLHLARAIIVKHGGSCSITCDGTRVNAQIQLPSI